MPGLRVEELAGQPGVRASGEVNLLTLHDWESALSVLPDGGNGEVHLRLDQLTSVDAAGAAAVAALAERLPPEGRVVLHDPPRALRRILQVLWPSLPGIEIREATARGLGVEA